MRWFFTGDEHYDHHNIIKYCGRPFPDVATMNAAMRDRHNEVVRPGDTVIHVGDYTMGRNAMFHYKQLNGTHIFLEGSHDKWLHRQARQIQEFEIEGQRIVACHYAMRVWPKSHYGAWQVYGHSHGKLPPQGKQWDVGVDNNNFYPVSFEQLKKIMETLPDNFNLIKGKARC